MSLHYCIDVVTILLYCCKRNARRDVDAILYAHSETQSQHNTRLSTVMEGTFVTSDLELCSVLFYFIIINN